MDINMKQETIVGFDIPKRELTEEEKNREITLDRFNEFHNKAGEDFCDIWILQRLSSGIIVYFK